MYNRAHLAFFLACSLTFIPLAMAHETHGAHEHGVAHMNLAVDGKDINIELMSPLANFLSFEHRPETHAQKQEVQDMVTKLRIEKALFIPNPEAKCSQTKLKLNSAVLDDDRAKEATHAQHKAKQHEKQAEHIDHADIRMDLAFSCDAPEKLTSIRSPLFTHFPALHEIHVQMVTPAGQKSAELTASSNTIRW